MRFRFGAVALVLSAAAPLSTRTAVASDAPKFDVTASCERKATKGRVICEVELEDTGGRIAWADVIVVAAPPFAPPLRSRVGMADSRSRTDARVRIPVALIATGLGRGTVAFRARATLCAVAADGPETCRPATKDVSAELVVGTDVEH